MLRWPDSAFGRRRSALLDWQCLGGDVWACWVGELLASREGRGDGSLIHQHPSIIVGRRRTSRDSQELIESGRKFMVVVLMVMTRSDPFIGRICYGPNHDDVRLSPVVVLASRQGKFT
jgi:hypothetical protein